MIYKSLQFTLIVYYQIIFVKQNDLYTTQENSFGKEQLHEVNKRNLKTTRGFLCFFSFNASTVGGVQMHSNCEFFSYGFRSLYLFTQVRGKLNDLSLPYNNNVAFSCYSTKTVYSPLRLLSKPQIFQCHLCKQNDHTERCETKTLSDH